MTTRWFIRGYDRDTTRLGMECTIGPGALAGVLDLLPTAGDPALLGPHRLDLDQAARATGLLGIAMNPDRFDYFVEAQDDWRAVAARREERLLSYVREADGS